MFLMPADGGYILSETNIKHKYQRKQKSKSV